jgi:hypothetical protein
MKEMKIEAKQNKSTHLVQSVAPKSELAGDSIKRMEQLVRSILEEPRGLLMAIVPILEVDGISKR